MADDSAEKPSKGRLTPEEAQDLMTELAHANTARGVLDLKILVIHRRLSTGMTPIPGINVDPCK